MESKNKRTEIVLNEEGKLVYKKRNYWLVLTRTLLAGFNAPIDSYIGLLHSQGYGMTVKNAYRAGSLSE